MPSQWQAPGGGERARSRDAPRDTAPLGLYRKGGAARVCRSARDVSAIRHIRVGKHADRGCPIGSTSEDTWLRICTESPHPQPLSLRGEGSQTAGEFAPWGRWSRRPRQLAVETAPGGRAAAKSACADWGEEAVEIIAWS